MGKSLSLKGASFKDKLAVLTNPLYHIVRMGMGEHAGEQRVAKQGISILAGVKPEDYADTFGDRKVEGKDAKHTGENFATVMKNAAETVEAFARRHGEGKRGLVLVVADGVPMIWSQAALALYRAGTQRKYGPITSAIEGRARALTLQKKQMEREMGIAPMAEAPLA